VSGALEAARRLIEKPSNAVMGGDHTGVWLREDDVQTVARAFLKQHEALEKAVAALTEAEAILGGEYGDHYAVLCQQMIDLRSAITDSK
jgi:hypothetical protein